MGVQWPGEDGTSAFGANSGGVPISAERDGVYNRRMRARTVSTSFGSPLRGPFPVDIIALVGLLFATYCLQFFSGPGALLWMLRLDPGAILTGAVWRLVSYPFIGYGGQSLWILAELLMVAWFGRDVFLRLGRRRFWRTFLVVPLAAGIVAVLVAWVARGSALGATTILPLLQGQRFVLAVLTAAFATLFAQTTILLFFVIPVQARWFLAVELVIAVLGFAWTRDLAGFCGLLVGIFGTWALLSPGGPRTALRRAALRAREAWLRLRLDRARKRRGLQVLDGGRAGQPGRPKPTGKPWVH